jgi:hypothetical protein
MIAMEVLYLLGLAAACFGMGLYFASGKAFVKVQALEHLVREHQARLDRMKAAAAEARLGRRCLPCDERCPAYPCSAAQAVTGLKEGS